MSTSLLLLPLLLGLSSGDDDDLAARVTRLEQDNAELSRKLDILEGELERADFGDLVAPIGSSHHGLAPAASKVYERQSGLSIGGYGEAIYTDVDGGRASADFLRAILYVGYKFSDQWVFNSEIEIEHATTDRGGATSLEFAYLDYLPSDDFGVRAGLVLIPMGFVNELHEPPTFLAATRPQVETLILPTTWRENGVGVFGDAGPVSYRVYVVNGFDATGFGATGLRGGRQKGGQARADDLAVVARVDWTDTPGLLAGVSAYRGASGQAQAGLGDTDVTILEAHAEWKSGPWWLRGIYAMASVDDVAQLNAAGGLTGDDSVGEELRGAYVEAAYDVLTLLRPGSQASLRPFVRWESLDTQAEVPAGFRSDPANDLDIVTVGLQFQPLPSLVFKLDYENRDGGDDRVHLGMGYSF